MSDLRILAGSAKGRALQIPESARPTPARVRKSLFDILEHSYGTGPNEHGSSLLDLYAGAGGVGLEAASRGFTVTMVEQNPRAIETLERNKKLMRVEAKIIKADVRKWLERNTQSFEIVFIDPPFDQDILEITRAALTQKNLIAENGVMIVQHPIQLRREMQKICLEQRVYGSNVLSFHWLEQTVLENTVLENTAEASE
jgi:16S rRNA (guanine966-N2)-methyltransferase